MTVKESRTVSLLEKICKNKRRRVCCLLFHKLDMPPSLNDRKRKQNSQFIRKKNAKSSVEEFVACCFTSWICRLL